MLELHIAGPGLDVTRRLEPGEPALVLGRDADCGICLTDPNRNVSRRHLTVWNEDGKLHFLVLSVVNGVERDGSEVPPGARGVLEAGESLGLSTFRLVVRDPAGPDEDADPWGAFQREAAQLGGSAEAGDTVPAPLEDDPFGDWGFQSTFGPGVPGGTLNASALVPAEDLKPFLAGLGLDAVAPSALTQGELEALGRVTRIALQGLLQAWQDAADTRREAWGEDPVARNGREPNPLRMDTPLEAKLRYLFGGQASAHHAFPPDRALAQVATELTAHQQAQAEAARLAVESVIADHAPEALRQRLLGGGTRMFGSARAWDAFVRDHAERAGRRDEQVRQMLARHFARAYALALLRAKRDTSARPRS